MYGMNTAPLDLLRDTAPVLREFGVLPQSETTAVREDLILTVAAYIEAKDWAYDEDVISTVTFALVLPALNDAEYAAIQDLLS